jgi:hypothetical protein
VGNPDGEMAPEEPQPENTEEILRRGQELEAQSRALLEHLNERIEKSAELGEPPEHQQ